MIIEVKSSSVSETEKIGEQVANLLKPGDILAMFGDLGAGKTAFVRGVARKLGFGGSVTSPTYSIVNEYLGDVPLFHFDMYRLSTSEDLYDIGWDDYLDRGGIYAVEWSERIEDILPVDCYRITITGTGENERTIRIEREFDENSGN